ncbi:hypothetical protein GCM10011409_43190 [Lentibacillus populi]|uniref:Uncharacterized protein n=1 Tax=Lentibacillus populi TaxID=1827502 RepID=A0A9W5X7N4_9BACI|nr:hypothetical protein [Lentibacillus populi]GGB61309.1 hypothetical protein GCM10011409_43190 [Lentibacillus populi]
MTSMCLKPGINNVFITNDKNEGPILVLEKLTDNKIHLNFTLTGMMALKEPINEKLQTFYLYIFLTYQHGGRETEVISSSQIYCDKDILESETLNFTTTLTVPAKKLYSNQDFVWNYYSVKIAYIEKEAEDGADLNFLVNGIGNSLFQTKLNIVIKDGESYE